MGRGGVKEKHVPRAQLMFPACERDLPFATRYELKGEVWKRLALDDEVRSAPLTAAAHKAEAVGQPPALPPIRQKEPPSTDHLLGKVIGLIDSRHSERRCASLVEAAVRVKDGHAFAKDGDAQSLARQGQELPWFRLCRCPNPFVASFRRSSRR